MSTNSNNKNKLVVYSRQKGTGHTATDAVISQGDVTKSGEVDSNKVKVKKRPLASTVISSTNNSNSTKRDETSVSKKESLTNEKSDSPKVKRSRGSKLFGSFAKPKKLNNRVIITDSSEDEVIMVKGFYLNKPLSTNVPASDV